MVIMETIDYTMFKVEAWKVHRMVPKGIERLSKSMKQRGWINTSYITIDEDYNIIDGYYRLFAAMKNWIPVQYIMIKTNPKKNKK